MDENPKFPWMNAWMVFVSVAGLWLVVTQKTQAARNAYGWITTVCTALILLAVGAVAVKRWPTQAGIEGEPPAGAGLEEIAETYRTAWQTLRRQRWILAILGFVAAVNLIGGLTETALAIWAKSRAYGYTPAEFHWYPPTPEQVLNIFVAAERNLLARFVPGPGIGRSGLQFAALALVILVAAGWARRKLPGLSDDPAYARDSRFAMAFAAPLAVVSIAVVIGEVIAWYMLITSASPRATANAPLVHDSLRLLAKSVLGAGQGPIVPLVLIGRAMYVAIATGVLMSGLAGSLRRSQQGGMVTSDTFTRDVVCHLKPMAGLYVLMALIGFVSAVPQIAGPLIPSAAGFLSILGGLLGWAWVFGAIILMFAPYAVVVHDCGAWTAIGRSVRDWLQNPWEALSFVTVGFSIVVAPLTLMFLIESYTVRLGSWLYLADVAVYVVLSSLLAIFMVVAVWEFYRRISGAQSSQENVAE